VYGKRQRLFRGPFTLGKGVSAMTQIRKTFLKVHRDGIVDLSPDPPLLQRFPATRHVGNPK